MESYDMIPQVVRKKPADSDAPVPLGLDVLAALETVLDPNTTTAAKADVLRQVREARERAVRDRPDRQ